MRKCGQRGGLTVRLEGFLRHPPPWSRGGPLFRHLQPGGGRPPILSLVPVYPLPSGLIPVPWYQSAGSGGYKAAGRSRPPGLCHPRARWRPLRSYGRDAGRRTGDSFVASPGHLLNQSSTFNAVGGPPDGAAGARPLCVTLTATGAGGPVDGATGVSPLRHWSGHSTGGPTDGAAGARPPVSLPASRSRLDVT